MPTNIDLNEIREMGVDQVHDRIAEMEGSLLRLEFDHATKGIDNPMDIRILRRDLARVKTVLRSKELQEVDPASRKKIRNRRRNNR